MNRIIVALDGYKSIQDKECKNLLLDLEDYVWGFKINSALLQGGEHFISYLKQFGHVFADLKLYDIPNTVKNSTKILAEAGADFITVHISGGKDMVQAALEVAGTDKILGVGKLTSQVFTGKEAGDIFLAGEDYGLKGCIMPGSMLNYFDPVKMFNIQVTPGIRFERTNDDQKSIINPRNAIRAGADYLVIGRPITQAENPVEVVDQINEEIKKAEESYGNVVGENEGTGLPG